jgi:hypothetical protein
LGKWSLSAWASSLPRAAAADGSSGQVCLRAPRLAGNRAGSGVDVDAEGPARELLDVASGGGGHGRTITRNADIRYTTVIVSVRIMLSSWEPSIGIEPMTYALREACSLDPIA